MHYFFDRCNVCYSEKNNGQSKTKTQLRHSGRKALIRLLKQLGKAYSTVPASQIRAVFGPGSEEVSDFVNNLTEILLQKERAKRKSHRDSIDT
eukprot:m.225453 g.225453  ORF g.225453 m.225453 type:complete len:93 (+) comp40015_c0_seq37:146-424(+)